MVPMTPGRWVAVGAALIVGAIIAKQTVFAPDPISKHAQAFKACLDYRLADKAGTEHKRVDDTDVISSVGDEPRYGFFNIFLPVESTAAFNRRTDLQFDANTGVYWDPDPVLEHDFTAITEYAGGKVEFEYYSAGAPIDYTSDSIFYSTDAEAKVLPESWRQLDAAMKRCASVI